MDTNTIGPAASWRLAHDGKKVMALFESGGYTTSMHTLFESATKDGCIAEIARLNLEFDDGEQAQ